MTSLTGKTHQQLPGTVAPPSFGETMAGVTFQLSTGILVWVCFSPLGLCIAGTDVYPRSICFRDPWARQVLATFWLTLFMWLYSLRTIPKTGTSDPSIVDRLWSILPWLYVWHYVFSCSETRPRLFIMALLVTAWGLRLTYNFAIKGGFSGGEDYRWREVRTWFPGWRWEAFNLVFTCIYQQCVILAVTSPAVTAVYYDAPLGMWDALATALFLLFLVGETIADHQMFTFQTEKYRRIKAGEPLGSTYEHGFIDTGMWAVSRHPNYFCEVCLWWSFYIFAYAATNWPLNWTLLGPISITLLFTMPRASLDVAETLSSRKYVKYAEYQERVSRFVPWWPRDLSETLSDSPRSSNGFNSPRGLM